MMSAERIVKSVSPEPNTGCWLCTLSDNGRGYGRVVINGRAMQAHRVIYEQFRGPIPPMMDLDHLCRMKLCVNPDHLEPTTHRENVKRGLAGATTTARQRAKTHCPFGHEYSGVNLIVKPNGARGCRACAKRRDKVRTLLRPRKHITPKSHCKRGHLLTGPEVLISGNLRICLICRRLRDKRRRERGVA